MPIITIPASEIRKGDILTLTVPVTAAMAVSANAPQSISICFDSDDGRLNGSLCVEPDPDAKVERHDPDAELIEAMATAYWANAQVARWPELDESEKALYRPRIAAALAAAREAGAL